MYVEERKDKKGNLISYRLICSGKDLYSGKHKNYTKTWKIPTTLTGKKDIERALNKVKVEFQEEVERLSLGIQTQDKKVMFSDFANEWLENILKRNPDAYTYYKSSKQYLKIIIPYFAKYLINNIGPDLIQKFNDELASKTYKKQIVIVKNSINELIEETNQHKCKIAENIGINRLTLRIASQIGNQVSMTTAKAICKYFNVPISKYFDITTTDCRYSKATISGISTTLVMILAEAKRLRLVEQNYATKEYIKRPKGTKKQKEVFSQDEAREFVKCILNEEDPRKKAVLSIFIFTGLRKGEVAGLKFEDIDFDKKTLSVNRNNIYVSGFGVKIKSPKTKASKRTISMPQTLVDILNEYKIWWNEEKVLHGDLWLNSDYLFMQDNGQPINPCTIGQWVTKFELKHGFKHVPCHSLRHTATSLMIGSGIPLKVVSTILGHTSEAFTLQVYTHVLQGQQEQASITYNNFLCGNN